VKVEVGALKVRMLNEMDKQDELLVANKVAEEKAKYEQSGNTDKPPIVEPAIAAKKKKNISIKTISVAASWQIESAADVDKHLAEMRERILRELEDNTVVNIEF
ncbi:hypothetical protein JZU71_01380, partial [bacterium]|nr:hypothetical protein [bacterium]